MFRSQILCRGCSCSECSIRAWVSIGSPWWGIRGEISTWKVNLYSVRMVDWNRDLKDTILNNNNASARHTQRCACAVLQQSTRRLFLAIVAKLATSIGQRSIDHVLHTSHPFYYYFIIYSQIKFATKVKGHMLHTGHPFYRSKVNSHEPPILIYSKGVPFCERLANVSSIWDQYNSGCLMLIWEHFIVGLSWRRVAAGTRYLRCA